LTFVDESLPLAPAWCVTKDQLLVSLFPQSIRSYLQRPKDRKDLSTVPAVAALLENSPGPVALSYYDTENMVNLSYPGVQMVAGMMCAMLQQQDIDIDISALPRLQTMSKHMTPSTTSYTRVEGGIEITSHTSLPVSAGLASILGPLIGVNMTFARALDAPLAVPVDIQVQEDVDAEAMGEAAVEVAPEPPAPVKK